MKRNKLFSFAALLALTLATAAYIPCGALLAAETDQTPTAYGSEPSETEGETDTPDGSDTSDGSDEPVFPENSVFLTHSEPLRAGEQICFTYACSGEDVRVLLGSITYDSTKLTFEGAASLDQSWLINLNPTEPGVLNFIGNSTHNEGTSGVSQLFSLTFTLTEDAVTGDPISFYLSDADALKGDTQLTFAGSVCTFLVDRPISTDCTLTSLTPSHGQLIPAFDPAVTAYTLAVGYNCEKLVLDAVGADYATVELSDTTLQVGENTLTVKVTAESGDIKTYTLTVTRASDPNYIPSSQSLLSGITLSDGMLFPAFSPSITEYTVYLINDGNVTLSPVPALLGSAEQAVLNSTDGSVCALTSYAEDGSSTVYSFKVLRIQPSNGGETPSPSEPTYPPPTDGANGGTDSSPSSALPLPEPVIFFALIAVASVSIFFVGFVVGKLLTKHKNAPDTIPSSSISPIDSPEPEPTLPTTPSDPPEPDPTATSPDENQPK